MSSRLEGSPFTSISFIEMFLEKTIYDNIFIVIAMLLGSLTMPQHRKVIIVLGLIYIICGYFIAATIMQPPEHILSNLYAAIMIIFLSSTSDTPPFFL
jgi:flagellar motor component MotA